MPEEQPVTILIGDGGRLMSDRPLAAVGANNFVSKKNWRREGIGETAELVKREGWLAFKPNPPGNAGHQRTISASHTVQQIGEATRPNGTRVPVGVCDGKLWWFSYDTSAWVQLASGLQTTGIRRWQIVNIGTDVVFNNGVDLPYVWRIGEANAVPLYQLREAGYASVAHIWEYNQVLKCADCTEILPAQLASVMNSGTPYGIVTDPTKLQRVQFRKVWSNLGDARDFAAVVNGTGTAGSPNITLAWPMASLAAGDPIVVLGGGAAGGNLFTTIDSISGTALVLDDNLVTSVSDTPISRPSALDSIVGFYDFEDDGTPITCGGKLQNREVVYKSNRIYVGYYTGDLSEPFAYDSVYVGNDTPRWTNTLINVGAYHLYAGADNFYRFSLGELDPVVHEPLVDCKDSLFFNLLANETNETVFAADNATTSEVWFFRSGGALAFNYENGDVDEVTGADFTCAASIFRPTAGSRADENTVWFIFGDSAGRVTQYGKTNRAIVTMQRAVGAGSEAPFESSWRTGLGSFGTRFQTKVMLSWSLLNSVAASSAACVFRLYGADRDNLAATLLETKTITNASIPTIVPLFYEKIYFAEDLATSATTQVRVHGRIWSMFAANSKSIDRRTASP
jgi:hypothetical protein